MQDRLYEQYFEQMPCYLSVQGPDLKVLSANARFRQDFGEFAGRHCYQVYKQRAEPCENCPVERTFHDGMSHRSKERVVCLDGRWVEVLVSTTPIRDESGKITAVMEMSTDVTEMQVLQEQLRRSQERFRELFEEVPCYITVQNRDLKIVEANRHFIDHFGNGLGCDCHSVYKRRDEPCIPCPVAEAFADGRVHHSEEVVRSKQGELVNTLVYAAPLHGPNGEIERVMEMSADITPIRQLQSQLESVGLLISSISHGIKGLLNGLDGGVYLVNSGMQKNDPKRLEQGWEMVQRNVERIRSMVLNILYYAKEREPQREPVAVAALAQEALEAVRSRAVELGVELRVEVPETSGSFAVDPIAMRSLVVNLLENSLDACRADKKEGHWVRFAAEGDAEQVRLTVADNGIGMDQETRDKAFSLFFSSKGAKGTGLGLFIANAIARGHGGQIAITSEAGQGSCLTVAIPREYCGPARRIVPHEQGVSYERGEEDHSGG